ncbi:hypothetical protein WICPIJ_005744 [Wickerhamomyces pijperi]|uniref:Uncharacterized protein n=1 Tax=Wickerhamomyces pijperi TaxID=599730 RepID=A0A9P8Q5B0_WICPI|nr:hypothetical protein WICPIJ_005744 [Wickerhamomyces pijperi]
MLKSVNPKLSAMWSTVICSASGELRGIEGLSTFDNGDSSTGLTDSRKYHGVACSDESFSSLTFDCV